jgi:hypothetical protein
LVAVVLAVVATGCTGSSDAGPTNVASVDSPPSPSPTLSVATPSPSTTPTVSATPPVAKPKRPAGMNANTVEGAKKTALYFLRVYSYALGTGDVSELDALSFKGHGDANCGFCSSARARALTYAKKSQTFRGGEIRAKIVKTYMRDALYDAFPLDISIRQDAGTVRNADGSVSAYTDASDTVARVEVIRVDRGWKILTIAAKKGAS